MKITIEDKWRIIVTEFKNSDVAMPEIIEALKGMLLTYGFHINTINDYLKNEDYE